MFLGFRGIFVAEGFLVWWGTEGVWGDGRDGLIRASIPGPQMRGTGGTHVVSGNGYRGRGTRVGNGLDIARAGLTEGGVGVSYT